MAKLDNLAGQYHTKHEFCWKNFRQPTSACLTLCPTRRPTGWLRSSGMGVIIQDIVGQVEAAMSKRLPIPLGTLESKAKALEEGVLFAWDVGEREVVFKSDSKIIIDALREVSEALTTICNIIKGI